MTKAKRKATLSLLAFCAPALLFYGVFMLYPLLSAFYWSMTDWNGIFRTHNFVGLANFIEAITSDSRFRYSLGYTFRFVGIIVFLQNILALSIALLIESFRRKKVRGFFRTVFFMPNIMSVYIGSLMWLFIFSRIFPQLSAHAFLSFLDQSWLGNRNWATVSIMMVALWHGTGYLMIIYIAALQGVPKELLEAAVIDGANSIQRFRRVIFPLLMPAITICLFLTLNGSFRIFEPVWALTRGGPGFATEVVAMNIYLEGFSQNMRFGYATAKSIILFFIILIFTLTQVTITKRREVEM